MSQILPTYNIKEKVWSGPEFDHRKFDVPFGELMLNDLAKHGDKLIQVGSCRNVIKANSSLIFFVDKS